MIFFTSCGTVKDAGKVLRNEKIKTTDEFLVKKRNPLVLPPDFEKIPEPNSVLEKKEDGKQNIQQILKAPKSESKSINKSSSVEESVLKRIRK